MATASAPVVQYGRRKGSSRRQAAGNRTILGCDLSIKPVDLRQVAVLPKADWERIVNYNNTLEIEARRLYEERKEEEALHLRSQEVVKNWTNTISGLRQKRLKAKQVREEKEEEEKKKIDLVEAHYQAEKRREAIEKARTDQYYQTDKVKTFHSALLLTEVRKEQDAQLELKNKIMNMSNKQGKDTLANMQRELEESIYNDQQKALQSLTERKKNANELFKQMEDHRHAAELEKQTNYREGEEIRRLTRLHEWEMNKLAKLKLEEKKELMRAHLAHVADTNLLREIEKRKEEENDDLVRRFILAKKKMSNLKKEREDELHRQTVERRDRISGLLAAQMKQKVIDEAERIKNAEAEMEAKNKKETEQKEKKMKADIKAITEHRLRTRREKEEEEKAEKLKALQALYEIREADNFFFDQQKEKMRQTEDQCKKVQSMQIQQMAEKKVMSQAEKEAEVAYDQQNEALMIKEEDAFQEYAKQVIDSVTKAGCNAYTLKKAAQSGTGGGHGPVYSGRGGIRPSYLVQDTSGVQLPAYQNGTTQQIKEIYDTGNIQQAKRKLGFTY
ncbi:PREDICTED: coiled-coil domain-containing protein 173 [Nanorana parkeri]|uniref:coiled-coil domain-containing protein 173 n=1 Tax=Nanorana parkeri TaxID=125878 RepID=UPI000854405E|nr:PREDICTED: coiled-coil domain-containing protein 173 [Nanorana parkeri]